ncbi:MAG: hypothetical protein M1368_10510, partial [Thaumarchaeota archaeon]|nr:hypothetical protein [Nitrososphaerota archaeon]
REFRAGSVEKYLQLGLRLSTKYDVGEYLRSRFVLASEELATLFKPEGHQSDINDYFSGAQDSQTEERSIIDHIVKTTEPALNSLGKQEHEQLGKRKKAKPVEQFQTTLF